jgi:hypothetical protein
VSSLPDEPLTLLDVTHAFFTTWVGINFTARYDPAMSSASAEIGQRIRSHVDEIAADLRHASVALESGDLTVAEMTHVMTTAFTNRMDAALTGAIGALDRAAQKAPRQRADRTAVLRRLAEPEPQHQLQRRLRPVRLARQLPYLPDTASAFERGDISPQHASVVARSVELVTRGGGDASDAESLLLEEAGQRDPRDLFRWGLSLVHQLAPREMEAEEQRREERRYLHMREAFEGGCDIEGYLDPERAARLKTAINGVLGPRRKGDERSPGQRRADGLDELAGRALDSGELPVRGGQRPHLTITATLETLRGDPGAPAALLDWGYPLSGKALRRIAGDAEITPILLNGRGDPLHVGRKYRTATPKMRRALAERDRKCVWPGCSDPPDRTQGHHEVPWALGGGTDVDEMSLLCLDHHQKLDQGWRLERLPDGRRVAHPPILDSRTRHASPLQAGPVWGPAAHHPQPRAP